MRILALLFLSSFIAFTLQAQDSTSQVPSSPGMDMSTPKDYRIADITVSGARFLDASAIVSLTGLKIGDKLRIPGDGVTNAVKKLWDQGLLGNIEVNILKIEGDNIYLDFFLTERPRLSRFSFKGATKSEQDDIKDKIKLIRGKIITDAALKNTQNTIKKFYAEKGFMNAEVKISQTADTSLNNSVALVINIERKKKVKIAILDIDGNVDFTDKKLRSKMKKTKQKQPGRVWARSKFILVKYEEDKAKLMEYYNEKGYRDARMISDTVYQYKKSEIKGGKVRRRERKKKDVVIKIKIEEGKKYYFRNVTWTGNYLYKSEYLGSILGIKKGDVYNTKELEKRLNYNPNGADVSSLYMDDGYLFFHVEPVEVMIENDSIDVEMRVYEGAQATIDRILISGNTKTNDHVIQREIRTFPGDKFSRADLIRSQRELSQLGYFDPEKIEILPKPNPAKGTVDIEYNMTEKPSDQLQLSGGYGGYFGLVGSLGLAFNNFSARNILKFREWSPLPAGDGQRLNLSVQANGPTYQSYSVSFSEPWLGGRRPNSLTVGLSHSIQNLGNYNAFGIGNGLGATSSYYGNSGKLSISNFSVSYGRRLRWPDDYFVLSHTAAYAIYNLNGYSLRSITGNDLPQTGVVNNISVTNSLSRNSIDNPTFPRSGSSVSLSLSLTPPYSLFRSSDNYDNVDILEKYKFVEYHKWMFDLSYFHQLLGKFVLNTRTHYGFLGAYNSKLGTGPFERFYLGGNGLAGFNFLLGYDIIGLRGYQNNLVQSRYTGGASTAFAKHVFELRYPITLSPMASIYVLGFFEAGNAWGTAKEYSPFDLKRSYGVGARIFMPAFGLIGVDYGIPLDNIRGYNGDPSMKFMFSIGQQIR